MTRNHETLRAGFARYRTKNPDIASGRAKSLETLPADIVRYRILNTAEAACYRYSLGEMILFRLVQDYAS